MSPEGKGEKDEVASVCVRQSPAIGPRLVVGPRPPPFGEGGWPASLIYCVRTDLLLNEGKMSDFPRSGPIGSCHLPFYQGQEESRLNQVTQFSL